jgi:hypothetical protein
MATVHAIRQSGVLDLPLGVALLDTPSRNKETAFRQSERTNVGLHGLLPPQVESLQEQVVCAYEAYQKKDNDVELGANSAALKDPSAPLLPPRIDVRRVAAEMAFAVGVEAQKDRVAPKPNEKELRVRVAATQLIPAYAPFVAPGT